MLGTLNEKTTQQQCTDLLLTEVYIFLNGYSLDIMNAVFHLRQNTDLPRNNCMLNSVVYRANQLWETLLFDSKTHAR